MNTEEQKLKAAQHALKYVEDGMRVGLGTGSTAAKFVDLLAQKVQDGLNVLCVPTSEVTQQQAMRLGIPLTTLDAEPHLDLIVDGADELDNDLRLIKGGGGALLHEKIVAMASDHMIVIADQSKLVETLGKFPLPMEIIPFGRGATQNMIDALAGAANCEGEITLRADEGGTPFVTDSGNYILDCAFGKIPDPELLAEMLTLVPGLVETGLFLGIADIAIVAGDDGVTILEAPEE